MPGWRKKKAGTLPKGNIFASYKRVFSDARWRHNLLIGSLIAATGVVGLWAIGEYAVDLQRNIFTTYYTKLGVENIKSHVERAATYAFILNMLGAGTGMWIFTKVAAATGRRFAFAVGFSAALIVTAFTYWKMSTPMDAYWMMPLMGAAQFSVFAGFSIYLPELFGSSVRSTGVSFCYNLGRFAAAGGSFFSFILSKHVFWNGNPNSPTPLRYAAISMCSIFLVGLATLPFGPRPGERRYRIIHLEGQTGQSSVIKSSISLCNATVSDNLRLIKRHRGFDFKLFLYLRY